MKRILNNLFFLSLIGLIIWMCHNDKVREGEQYGDIKVQVISNPIETYWHKGGMVYERKLLVRQLRDTTLYRLTEGLDDSTYFNSKKGQIMILEDAHRSQFFKLKSN